MTWLSLVALAISLFALFAKWQEKPRLKIFLRDNSHADGSRNGVQWRFVHLTVENPRVPAIVGWFTYRQPARTTRLELGYSMIDGNREKFHFDGRWSGNPQPVQLRLINGKPQELFDPWLVFQGRFKDIVSGGSLEDVAIAVKLKGQDDCYGFTNESYECPKPFWQLGEYRLPRGIITVTARAVSGEVTSKTTRFLLHNDGPALTDLWLDVPKTSWWQRTREQLGFGRAWRSRHTCL
ncbi:MAG: hypothetical protein ACYC3V_07110 [Chloroflexota bacterium]